MTFRLIVKVLVLYLIFPSMQDEDKIKEIRDKINSKITEHYQAGGPVFDETRLDQVVGALDALEWVLEEDEELMGFDED